MAPCSMFSSWRCAGTRDSEHIVGQIKADDRRAREGWSELGAVARTTAEVENPIRLELRNLSEKITRRARALVLEFHIEGGIPISHGFTGRI